MSTTRDRGNFVFQCDVAACRDTLQTATSNFDAARNMLRRAGWKPTRNPAGRAHADDEWRHRCAGCVKAGARLS